MDQSINVERQLDAATILLKNYDAIHNKIQTFGSLEHLFGLRMNDVFSLLREKFITIDYCYLMAEYIHMYKTQKPQVVDVGNASFLYNLDGVPEGIYQNCGLPEKLYKELLKKGSVAVDLTDYIDTADQKFSPLKFMNMKIEIDGDKLAEFLRHYNRIIPFSFIFNKEVGVKKPKKNLPKIVKSDYVREILCVKPKNNSNKFRVIINRNDQGIFGDMIKPTWQLLFKVADEKAAFCEDKKRCKNSISYFNKNEGNRIYTRGGYKPTKILRQDGEYVAAEDGVTIEMISHKAFLIRYTKS